MSMTASGLVRDYNDIHAYNEQMIYFKIEFSAHCSLNFVRVSECARNRHN